MDNLAQNFRDAITGIRRSACLLDEISEGNEDMKRMVEELDACQRRVAEIYRSLTEE